MSDFVLPLKLNADSALPEMTGDPIVRNIRYAILYYRVAAAYAVESRVAMTPDRRKSASLMSMHNGIRAQKHEAEAERHILDQQTQAPSMPQVSGVTENGPTYV